MNLENNPIAAFYSDIIPDSGDFSCLADTSCGKWYQKFIPNLKEIVCDIDVDNKEIRLSVLRFSDKARKLTTAQVARAFFIDLDSHEKTSRELASELVVAVTTLKLPMPWVVESGNGLHVFFPLTADLDVLEWRVLNRALAKALSEAGLEVDMAASGLPTASTRLIGSINIKNGNVVTLSSRFIGESESVGFYQTLLRDHIQQIEIHEAKPFSPPTKCAESIIQGCQQVREAGVQSEPIWHRMMTVMERTTTFEESVHALSSEYTGYSEYETDDKIERVRGQDKPATCREFAMQRGGVCNTCPHFQKIKSPVELGNTHIVEVNSSVEVTPIQVFANTAFKTPLLPQQSLSRLAVNTQGCVVYQSKEGIFASLPKPNKKAKEGEEAQVEFEEVRITDFNLFPKAVSYLVLPNGNRDYNIYWEVKGKGLTNHAITGTADISDPTKAVTLMAQVGLIVQKKSHYSLLGEFMRTLAQAAIETLPASEVFSNFGWNDDTFYVNNCVYSPKGILHAPPNSHIAVFAKMVERKGDLTSWLKGIQVFDSEKYIREQFILLAGIAAPIMRFTGVNGFIIHLDGESGAGKSTLQKFIASMWGDPESSMMRAVGSKTGDTQNSAGRRMGVFHSLPVCVDEITNADREWVSDFIYNVSMGAERGRLKSSADAAQAKSWRTIVVTSANGSLVDKLAASKPDIEAELMRMFEFKFNVPETPDEEADWTVRSAIFDKALRNHGVAGHVLAQWLVSNVEELPTMVADAKKKLTALFKTQQSERIWLSVMSAIWVAAHLANASGIMDVDLDRLEQFMVATILEHRDLVRRRVQVQVDTRDDYLGSIITDLRPFFYVVLRDGKPRDVNEEFNYVKHRPSSYREAKGRVALEEKLLYVTRDALTAWAKQRGIGLSTVISSILNHENVLTIEECKPTLGKNIEGDVHIQQRAFKIQLKSLAEDMV